MSEAATEAGDVDDLIARLRRTATAHEEARARVAEAGEQRVQRLAEYYREITGLMERYEYRIVSDGEGDVDMDLFIEYQEELAHFVEHLPEDLDHRDAFEQVDEIMHQKWLKTDDFEDARAALSPVANLIERLDERERTRERLESAAHDARVRLREIEDRIDDHERLVTLGEADLDAPTERLRDSIETYNEAVTTAFESFRRETSAREVIEFVVATEPFPLVGFRQPPADLREYVTDSGAGTEPIPQLLEYAEYSTSKLYHYIEDAHALERNVATHQTYLRRLDAEPLTVGWPPPSADRLRWRCRELIPVVDKFAGDEVLEPLRTVRQLPYTVDYERLRESAVSRAELGERERERLRSGQVEAELRRLRERLERLGEALEEYA